MKEYTVQWSKTYIASGQVVIEANSVEEALNTAMENIGDYTGSMQYIPDEDYVETLDDEDG